MYLIMLSVKLAAILSRGEELILTVTVERMFFSWMMISNHISPSEFMCLPESVWNCRLLCTHDINVLLLFDNLVRISF